MRRRKKAQAGAATPVIDQPAPSWRRYSAAYAGIMLLLALIGGVRGYTAIPWWDMWDGVIGFMAALNQGDNNVWWVQHNEHRIVLSRLLFWLDERLFGGQYIFLIAVNYLLVLATAALFWRMLKDLCWPAPLSPTERAFAWLLTAWLFLWTQSDNLTSPFQSQFILAQLLPLAALYALAVSVQRGRVWFMLACVLGVLALGAMANGVLALPLLALYALWLRQSAWRVAVLALLALLCSWLYFHDFAAPSEHSSPLQTLLAHPLDALHYVCLYLGSPFHYLVFKGYLGRALASIMGAVLLGLTLRFTWQAWRSRAPAAVPLALLFFLAYVCASAVGTAGGRLLFGDQTALSQRYTTPVLMAWAAMCLLCLPQWRAWLSSRQRWTRCGLVGLLVLMLIVQLYALKPLGGKMWQRQLAVLAMELAVRDTAQLELLYPEPLRLQTVIEQARIQKLSVFADPVYAGVREQLGQVISLNAWLPAVGQIVEQNVLKDDARFVRVFGTLASEHNATPALALVDADGRMQGYALVHPAADSSGQQLFSGYLLSGNASAQLHLLRRP